MREVVPVLLDSPPKAAAILSAGNRLKGKVVSVKLGTLVAEVVVKTGDSEIVSAITSESAEKMGLKAGAPDMAIIKATDVLPSNA